MDPFLIKAIQLLLSLSLLIVLHEFGHFIPAKLFKTRVEKFYLFFDVKFALFKKKIGGTEYGLGWLPLGGYVKISGMIDESMDKEQMALPPKPWEFRSKPAWQRLIIMHRLSREYEYHRVPSPWRPGGPPRTNVRAAGVRGREPRHARGRGTPCSRPRIA